MYCIFVYVYLRNGPCFARIYRVMDARGKLGEHERSIWVARGEAENFPSFSSTLPTSQVHPLLGRCTAKSCTIYFRTLPLHFSSLYTKTSRKLIKYRILLNHSERFDWLNAITRFDKHTGVHLSRFRCTLGLCKKRAKIASYVLKI